MALLATLVAVTITPTEQSTVQGVTPFEDPTGELTAIIASLQQIKARLTYFNANMPSGTNKTNIASAISAMA